MAVNGLLGADVPSWLGDWLLGQGATYAPMSPQLGYNNQSSADWLQNWRNSRLTNMGQVNSITPPTNTPVVLQGAKGLFDSLGGGGDGPFGPPGPVGTPSMSSFGNIGYGVGTAFGLAFGVPGLGMIGEAIGEATAANAMNDNVTLGEDLSVAIDPVSAALSAIGMFGISPFGVPANEQMAEQDALFSELNMTPLTLEDVQAAWGQATGQPGSSGDNDPADVGGTGDPGTGGNPSPSSTSNEAADEEAGGVDSGGDAGPGDDPGSGDGGPDDGEGGDW